MTEDDPQRKDFTTTSAPTVISRNALERRVKRWLAGGPFDCFVQVAPGLESILASELLDLGLAARREGLSVSRGGVGLELDQEGIMSANLELRTAGRVMLRLGSFPAVNREMLYDRARKIAWEVQLGFASGYRLRVTSKNSKLLAGDEVTNTVASAISRHMREFGLYPKPTDEAGLEFHVRLLDDRCTISLNTSGEHLHRRGMRTHVHTAPVRETLAAAMALTGPASMRERPDVIVDPFCGSGTLLLEAADVVAAAAPGRQRSFAFQQTGWFREGRWREVQRVVQRRVKSHGAAGEAPRFIGIDSSKAALDAARANVARSGHAIELLQADSTAFEYAELGAQQGLILANLPYGLRLGDRQEAAATARRFLDRLAASGTPWHLVLLLNDPAVVREHDAVDTDSIIATSNGGVPVVMVSGRVGSSRQAPSNPPVTESPIPADPGGAMTTASSHTLQTTNAELTYDVRAAEASDKPLLLLVGCPMGASGFSTLAGHFADRTVVTYDPRGVERSRRTDGKIATSTDEHADDLSRLITEVAIGPVDIFGSSGGAVNALALVAKHPEQVRMLVAHEPPAIDVLPDREAALAVTKDIYDTYQRSGMGPAMAKFIALVGYEGELTNDYISRAAPDPAMFGLPTEDDGSRDDILLGQNLMGTTGHEYDFDALRSASTTLVLGAGAESTGTLANRGAHAVADRLGTEPVIFPSGHSGFMGGEYGQRGEPEAFAAKLREVLDGA